MIFIALIPWIILVLCIIFDIPKFTTKITDYKCSHENKNNPYCQECDVFYLGGTRDFIDDCWENKISEMREGK